MHELPSPADIQTEEYWQAHGPEDDCHWQTTPGTVRREGIWQQHKADNFSRNVLKEFLKVEHTPVKTIPQGEAFDGEQFSEGTVIRFEREVFNLGPMDQANPVPRYRKEDFWGVIAGCDVGDQRRTVLMRYKTSPDYSNARFVYPGYLQDPGIRVGETEHHRIDLGPKATLERLDRVNHVTVYQIGKGIRERTPRRKWLPSFSILPGRPVPNLA